MNQKRDIENYEDIVLMVDHFYEKLLRDNSINHFFISLNLEEHLPNIYEFWNTLLLGSMTYKRNMMEAHERLQFQKEDFYTWLRLFEETVSALYEGPRADEAISRANVIALTMRAKLMSK